jgi:hypothetical protein
LRNYSSTAKRHAFLFCDRNVLVTGWFLNVLLIAPRQLSVSIFLAIIPLFSRRMAFFGFTNPLQRYFGAFFVPIVRKRPALGI